MKDDTKNKTRKTHIPQHDPTQPLISSSHSSPLCTSYETTPHNTDKIFSPPLHVILTSQNRFCSNKILARFGVFSPFFEDFK
jgi:hypothetical protein